MAPHPRPVPGERPAPPGDGPEEHPSGRVDVGQGGKAAFPGYRWGTLALGGLLVAVGLWLQRPQVLAGDPMAHLLLVGTAAVLVLYRLAGSGRAHARDVWLGVLLALSAAAAAVVAPLAGALRPVLLHGALSLLALSAVAALFGTRTAGRLAVPLLVLYALVPVLPLLEAALSYPMRRLSALLAAGLLSLAPGETHLAGTELSWGGSR
jgi:hypothetical protein